MAPIEPEYQAPCHQKEEVTLAVSDNTICRCQADYLPQAHQASSMAGMLAALYSEGVCSGSVASRSNGATCIHTQMPLTASGNAKLIQPHRCHSCSHRCCHRHWSMVPALSSSPPAAMVSAQVSFWDSHLQQGARHSDMTGLKCWLPSAWPDAVQAQLLTWLKPSFQVIWTA